MSKVIFKMSFKHPNLKDTRSKNMSHVEYISTRPGTDKTITEADLKKELEKGIEDLSSSNEVYAKYINERPKSHGLFGQNGLEDLEKIKKELYNAKSFVWRGIISLKEDDAKKLGYLKKEQWQDMLRKKIPDMAAEMGISITNLRWVGAVHMEKGHPHAHIMLWEKDPQRTVGVVNNKTINNIRKMFTDEIFEEERFQLMNERTIMRELIRDLAKDNISKASQLIREVRNSGKELNVFLDDLNKEGVPPKLYSEEEKILFDKIDKLANKLPGKGRIALKYMPEEVKNEVREIADYLLQQPEMAASLAKNLNAMEKLTRMYTEKEDAIEKARINAYNDIRDRICQIILKGAVESQKNNFLYVDEELSKKAVDFIKNNIDIKIDSISNDYIDKTLKTLSTTLLVSGVSLEDTKKILSYSNIEAERLEKIIDKANKNISENNLWGKTTVISINDWKDMYSILGVKEDEIPKWIYKGESWSNFNYNMGFTIINDIWKSVWSALERQRLQTEYQSEYMKKQLNKQQSINQSKEAIKEQIRKSRDMTLFKDEELEL